MPAAGSSPALSGLPLPCQVPLGTAACPRCRQWRMANDKRDAEVQQRVLYFGIEFLSLLSPSPGYLLLPYSSPFSK